MLLDEAESSSRIMPRRKWRREAQGNRCEACCTAICHTFATAIFFILVCAAALFAALQYVNVPLLELLLPKSEANNNFASMAAPSIRLPSSIDQHDSWPPPVAGNALPCNATAITGSSAMGPGSPCVALPSQTAVSEPSASVLSREVPTRPSVSPAPLAAASPPPASSPPPAASPSPAAASPTDAAAALPHMSFVRADGGKLVLDDDGQTPFRFVGLNMWHSAWIVALGDLKRLRRELDVLQAHGVSVLRVVAASEGASDAPLQVAPTLQPTPGKFDEAMAAALEQVLLGSSLSLSLCPTLGFLSRRCLISRFLLLARCFLAPSSSSTRCCSSCVDAVCALYSPSTTSGRGAGGWPPI